MSWVKSSCTSAMAPSPKSSRTAPTPATSPGRPARSVRLRQNKLLTRSGGNDALIESEDAIECRQLEKASNRWRHVPQDQLAAMGPHPEVRSQQRPETRAVDEGCLSQVDHDPT